jgi:hypothetical protein
MSACVLTLLAASLAGPETSGTIEARLQQAFPGSEVRSFAIRVHLRSKGLLIAADSLSITADGRAKLGPCALARFAGGKGGRPSLQTAVRSRYALVEMDRPVSSFSDLASGKIVSVKLAGGVRLTLDP